jgi:hypothetical protein
MKKNFANFLGPVFTSASGNQRLQTVVQTISDNCKDEIVYPGDTGTRQLLLPQSAQKDIVGNEIDLRYQYGQRDG